MRKSRFTDAQIIGMIKEQEAGLPTADLCRKHGLSSCDILQAEGQIRRDGLVRCQTPEAA